MSFEGALFWVCALTAVLGAVATIAARSPIRNAMGLLLTIASIAGLYLTLHAELLAATQLIVYAGAVIVLFVFVIMLLGPDATPVTDTKGAFPRIAGAAGLGIFSLVLGALLLRSSGGPHPMPPARDELGTVESIGKTIFTEALVPFELVTALFLAAIVGAVAMARSRQKHEPIASRTSPSQGGQS